MSQNVKDTINQDKKDLIMNTGALMMMEDTEPKTAAFLVKRLPTLEESKMPNALTEKTKKPPDQESTAHVLKPIMNAICSSLETKLDNVNIYRAHLRENTIKNKDKIKMQIAKPKASGPKIPDIERSQEINAEEEQT